MFPSFRPGYWAPTLPIQGGAIQGAWDRGGAWAPGRLDPVSAPVSIRDILPPPGLLGARPLEAMLGGPASTAIQRGANLDITI